MNRSKLEEKLARDPRYARQIADQTAPKAKGRVRRRHNSEWCEDAAGRRFPSKLERTIFGRLCRAFGEKRVVRQVSIPIGDRRMRPDFLVIHEIREDGTFVGQLFDAKGYSEREWRLRANHLKDAYGLPITLLKE